MRRVENIDSFSERQPNLIRFQIPLHTQADFFGPIEQCWINSSKLLKQTQLPEFSQLNCFLAVNKIMNEL